MGLINTGFQNIVIDSRSKISLDNECLKIERDDVLLIPLVNINSIIITSSQVSITSAVIGRIVDYNILLLFNDVVQHQFRLVQNLQQNTNLLEVRSKQINWDEETKWQLWKNIVINKIKTEENVCKKELMPKETIINKDNINFYEGNAAKDYFRTIFGRDFTRGKDCEINHGLNYGYAILIGIIARAIVSHGYLLEFGIHHCNNTNNYNFAYDLIEPFRFMVDKIVLAHIGQPLSSYKDELISIGNSSIYYCEKEYTINTAIDAFANDLFNALNNNKIISFNIHG